MTESEALKYAAKMLEKAVHRDAYFDLETRMAAFFAANWLEQMAEDERYRKKVSDVRLSVVEC